MKTLIIYDDNGVIFHQISGDYIKPEGLQHLEIEVPQGKRVSGVDLTNEPHKATFEDVPKTEMELMREELNATQEALDFLLAGGM